MILFLTEVAVLCSFRGGHRLPMLVRVYTLTLQIVRAQKKETSTIGNFLFYIYNLSE